MEMNMTLKSTDYYAGRDVAYPDRPSKPVVSDRESPAAIRAYADALEAYNEAMETYRADKDAYNATLRDRQAELVVDLAAEYDLSPDQATVIFRKAWEDGHSGGIGEVIMIFEELLDMVEAFNKAA